MGRPGGFRRIAALWAFGMLAVAACLLSGAPAQALPAAEAPVYAIDNYPFQKAPALLRWRSVLQRDAHLMEKADPDACKAGEPRLACAAKEALLLEEKLQDKSPTEQVAAVYAYFNAIKYKEHDAANCGIDCWKSRLQFLAQREGDCGDHALAEYFTLKRLGFKERDLQLIVAQLPGFADSFKGGHVVLRVRAEDAYYILDNRSTDLADLSGLRRYKVLAGMNADSVQIYNLVTDEPPPGAVADASQFIRSPGAKQETAPVEIAEAPDAQPVEPVPEVKTFATQSTPKTEPTLVASAESTDDADDADTSTMCVQTASLADWNPFLPCTPVKVEKMVVKAKTIIGAEPPKPVQLAEAPKAPVVKTPETKTPEIKTVATKTPETKPAAAKLDLTKPAPKPAAAVAAAEEEDDSSACMQGSSLADWNPNLPCTPDGNSSSLRIEFKDKDAL
jgi:predicted transglutaminase-like cysteine proteinase